MNIRACWPDPQHDGRAQRVDGQLRRHGRVKRIDHDPIRGAFLHRAHIQIALKSPMLGEINYPLRVEGIRGEVLHYMLVIDSGPRLLSRPATFEDAGVDSKRRTQPLQAFLTDV